MKKETQEGEGRTPLIASKSLSQAPNVFLFMKNEESLNTLVKTWLNNHIHVLGSIFSPSGFTLAQQGLKSTFSDMQLAGWAIFSPSDSNTIVLVCHFRPASYQLALRVTLAPNGHFRPSKVDPRQYIRIGESFIDVCSAGLDLGAPRHDYLCKSQSFMSNHASLSLNLFSSTRIASYCFISHTHNRD